MNHAQKGGHNLEYVKPDFLATKIFFLLVDENEVVCKGRLSFSASFILTDAVIQDDWIRPAAHRDGMSNYLIYTI